MIGEIASFSNALGNALTNVLGGKSTQLGSWRNTLRFSSSIAMVILTLVILFNLNTAFTSMAGQTDLKTSDWQQIACLHTLFSRPKDGLVLFII